jgi:hypothetical protein
VGVGTDDRIGEGHPLAHLDHPAEVFEVHLVADAGSGRHHPEPLEGLLGPAQQLVALAVATVLPVDVGLVRLGRPEQVHLDRVVDHQVHRDERVHVRRIAAGTLDGAAHRGEIHHGGNPREVLHQDPGGHEGEIPRRPRPCRARAAVFVVHVARAAPAQEVLEEDLDRVRKPGDVGEPHLDERIEAIDVHGARPGLERGACTGQVAAHGSILPREPR